MDIQIFDCPSTINSGLVKKAVNFAASWLIPDLYKIKPISVFFVNNSDFYGSADYVYDTYVIELNHKLILDRNEHSIAEVLIHELVHVKQFYNGEIAVYNDYIVFKNKKYHYTTINIIKAVQGNSFLPWETEPYALQKRLTEKFEKEISENINFYA